MKQGELARVMVTFLEPVLGTLPKDTEIHKTHIVSKIVKNKTLSDEDRERLSAEELEAEYNDPEAMGARGHTGFAMEDGKPFVWDYWVKGFFKTAFQSLQETGDFGKIKGYKTKVDRYLHVRPRKIFFDPSGPIFELHRSLRVMMRVEGQFKMVVTVICSDALPAGSVLPFEIELLQNNSITIDMVEKALEWGRYEGMGQWRSGGYGKFDYSFERASDHGQKIKAA